MMKEYLEDQWWQKAREVAWWERIIFNIYEVQSSTYF